MIPAFIAYVVTALFIGVACAFFDDDWSYRPFVYAFIALAGLLVTVVTALWGIWSLAVSG